MMTTDRAANPAPVLANETEFDQEAMRVLRRLVENGAMLAVARDMDMGVIVRDVTGSGTPQRIAVVERRMAEAMVLKDWISCADPLARIARYTLTGAGRAALKRFLAPKEGGVHGMAESAARFSGHAEDDDADHLIRHMRSTMAESPLVGLARRRDKGGEPFLDRALVAAGDRLREDFELAQVEPQTTQNWERFLTAGASGLSQAGSLEIRHLGAKEAHGRVVAALTDLGPGLADVALRCCCFLEGLEHLEKRMGWSARSGKIVLRIALQRLIVHYQQTQGKYGPLIG